MFELSEELLLIQKTARRFAEREIRPIALELDQAPKDDFCWEIVRKGGEIGLLSFLIPEEYGGGGQAMMGYTILLEELSVACSGVATIFGAHGLGLAPILLSGDVEAWERFFPPVVAAERSDRPYLCAYAITEPEAGSDVEHEEGARTARLTTWARREGDEYIINGRKCFISNGSVASLVTVFATLDREAGIDAWTCFAVPTDTPGFVVGRVEDKMGQRACPAAELIFEDVRIPKENVIGGEGGGWLLNQQVLASSRGPVGAIAVGIARNAYEIALRYASERYQGGKPIIKHQAVKMMLADMAIKIEAARLLAWKASYLADTQLPPPRKEPAMAKTFASDIAVEVCLDAIQILGGYGYMRDYGVEKCLRDAKLCQIYEGTNQIQRLVILEEIERELNLT
jgi:alkylation response protein AidB-like acyl-CoA dehydrogenase